MSQGPNILYSSSEVVLSLDVLSDYLHQLGWICYNHLGLRHDWQCTSIWRVFSSKLAHANYFQRLVQNECLILTVTLIKLQ
jgi:hypothetical protein